MLKIKPLIVAVLLLTFAAHAQQKDWTTATPKSVGIDAKALAAFDADIAAGKFGNIDSFTLIRHGKLVIDKRYPHDYAQIYSAEAKKQSPLNPHDPTGPY